MPNALAPEHEALYSNAAGSGNEVAAGAEVFFAAYDEAIQPRNGEHIPDQEHVFMARLVPYWEFY